MRTLQHRGNWDRKYLAFPAPIVGKSLDQRKKGEQGMLFYRKPTVSPRLAQCHSATWEPETSGARIELISLMPGPGLLLDPSFCSLLPLR